MLSSIPVQLTDMQTFGGEGAPGTAAAPVGTGELVTFAELLRRPLAGRGGWPQPLATPGAVPGLPSGGKNLPGPVAAEARSGGADGELPALAVFEPPVMVAAAAQLPVTWSGAPGTLAAPVPAEYRFDMRNTKAAKLPPSSPVAPGLMPGSTAGGVATGHEANAAHGRVPSMQPLPTLPSSPTQPEMPVPFAGAAPARSDAPDVPVSLLAADGVAPAPAASRPELLPEAALAGLSPDKAVLPDVMQVSQPVMASQAPAGTALPAATAPAAAPTPTFASASLGVPVGEPAWADAFGDQVLVLAGKQVQRAEIRLHPAELGPVQVRITVEDDATTLAFTAQHAVTREAIEQALPRLRELFGDQGLSLLNTTVSEQGGRQDREAGLAGRGTGSGVADAGTPDDLDEPAVTPQRLAARNTLIDMFA